MPKSFFELTDVHTCLELFLYHFSLEQRERLIFLAKHAKHWRERQRAQTILWLSEGKSVAEVATLQERIPETIRIQRRRWELYEFESIKEGHRSGRPNTLISDYQAKILDWVKYKSTQCRTNPSQNYMKNTKCPCLLKPFVSFYVIQVWSSSVPVIA